MSKPIEVEVKFDDFMRDWDEGLIMEVIIIGNKVYGKTVKGQADNPKRHEVVSTVVT